MLLGLVAAWFLLSRDSITTETYHKVRLGMTRGEVEELAGGPGESKVIVRGNVGDFNWQKVLGVG